MKILKNIAGMATLETAVLLTVIVTFALGGVAVTNYIGALNAVSTAVDSAANDDGTKPFILQSSDAGSITLTLNHSALDGYLDTVVGSIARDVANQSVTEAQNNSTLKIDAQFEVIDIDPATGAFTGIDANATGVRELGALSAESNTCPNLTKFISDAVLQTETNGRSRYAIPTGLLSGVGAGNGYFDRTVLVAVRVLRDLSGITGSALYQDLGGNPLAESCKLIELRGEVGQ